MKELTIEEKAKAYDEAIIKFKPIYDLAKEQGRTIDVEEFENIFPELKESEDKRIRKALIEHFSWNTQQILNDFNNKEVIAWLEKQGEPNSNNNTVLKFNVGEWVVNNFGDAWHIDSIDNKNYKVSNGDKYCYFPIEKQNEIHRWTIQDAKPGDVLVNHGASYIVLFKSFAYSEDDIGMFKSYCHYREGVFSSIEDTGWYCIGFYPATKEQRDTLMKAMYDAGYTLDFEKKELKKTIEQKPTEWSKEDEEMLNQVIEDIVKLAGPYVCYNKDVDWLKSLKDRVGCEANCTTTKSGVKII